MLTLNLDADGCLYDYSGEFWRMASEHYGRTFPPSTEWGQHEVMGIDEDEYWDFFHHCAMNGVFRNGEAIPGGIESIRQWYKEGHRIRVVTHKTLRREESTYHAQTDMVHWLYSQGVLNKIELVFPKSHYHKQGFPADIVVDDKPDMKWIQGNGTINVLFDQPWNRNVEVESAQKIINPPYSASHTHEIEPTVVRASSWEEIQEIAKRVERRLKVREVTGE